MSLRTHSIFAKIALWFALVVIFMGIVWLGIKIASVEGEYGFDEKLAIVFGWGINNAESEDDTEPFTIIDEPEKDKTESKTESKPEFTHLTKAPTTNCTANYGSLMLVNPNFMVEEDFITARRSELISLYVTYGIRELNAWNGDNLIDAEAGEHLNEMLTAYKVDYPGQEMQTVSCFREVGTNCGRLCMPTGASDHHTGLACDLVDATYGTSLDTSTYEVHPDWQWLRANSYKYGFIDRFPEEWAGGPMSEPMDINENGSTGLFETWHYRYVGVDFATEIATGKYNDGKYDSLEHYLKARGLVTDLKTGKCAEKDV